MQYVGTSKISKLNPKPNLTYPLIRLPQRYRTIIGKTAHIDESWEEGQKAIVLVFDETENKEKVIQPVIKRNPESDFSARIAVLEGEIRELQTLIEKEAHFYANIQKTGGPGAIRTPDLRRVKAPNGAFTRRHNQLDHRPFLVPQILSELALPFSEEELVSYAERRKYGLSEYSVDWIDRSQKIVWAITQGVITKQTVDDLRLFVLKKYRSKWSHGKVLSFAKAFLTFLTKVRLDTRYHAFEVFLDRPKMIKARNNVTSRVVTKEDIENVLNHTSKVAKDGLISNLKFQNYTAFLLFGAFSGQRSLSTISKLTVRQFREALQSDKPCIEVQSSQDKIKMQHYVPLHPQVIQAIKPLLGNRNDDETFFEYTSLAPWVKRQQIPLSRIKGNFVLGDLRKFTEQYGDIIQWDQSNRAYIMTHGVSGIDWKHYKHPLPENVYDVYMQYWGDVSFTA